LRRRAAGVGLKRDLTVAQQIRHALAQRHLRAGIRDAIAFDREGMREDGLAMPAPTSWVESIELAA
jgi:hypothetical protein